MEDRKQSIEKYYKVSAWGFSEILGFNIFKRLSKTLLFYKNRIKTSNEKSSVMYETSGEPFGLVESVITVDSPSPCTRSISIEVYFDEPLRCNDYFQTIFQVFDNHDKIRKLKKLINNELN